MLVVHNVQYVYNVQYNGEYKSLDLADITSLYLPYYCQDPGPGPLGNLCIVVITNFNYSLWEGDNNFYTKFKRWSRCNSIIIIIL